MSKKKKIIIPSEEEIEQFGKNEKPVPQEQPSDEKAPDQPEQADHTAQPKPQEEAAESEISEAQEWKDKYLRAKADLLNYQRRAEKSRSEALKYANAGLAKALLPILDDLERVIDADTDQDINAQTLREGVKLTLDNFFKVLRDYNIVPIEATGKPFDPTVHEAMMEDPNTEHPQRMVLQELAKGYQLHDRTIRPAKVTVSKQSSESEDKEEETAATEQNNSNTQEE